MGRVVPPVEVDDVNRRQIRRDRAPCSLIGSGWRCNANDLLYDTCIVAAPEKREKLFPNNIRNASPARRRVLELQHSTMPDIIPSTLVQETSGSEEELSSKTEAC